MRREGMCLAVHVAVPWRPGSGRRGEAASVCNARPGRARPGVVRRPPEGRTAQ